MLNVLHGTTDASKEPLFLSAGGKSSCKFILTGEAFDF